MAAISPPHRFAASDRRAGFSAEHVEIVDATLSRDSAKACAALTKHIENTSRTVEVSIFGG